MSDTVVYLKMDTKVKIAETTIQIGDLGKIYCQNVHITNKIKPLKVHVFQQKDKGRCVISALKVTELIYATCPRYYGSHRNYCGTGQSKAQS